MNLKKLGFPQESHTWSKPKAWASQRETSLPERGFQLVNGYNEANQWWAGAYLALDHTLTGIPEMYISLALYLKTLFQDPSEVAESLSLFLVATLNKYSSSDFHY